MSSVTEQPLLTQGNVEAPNLSRSNRIEEKFSHLQKVTLYMALTSKTSIQTKGLCRARGLLRPLAALGGIVLGIAVLVRTIAFPILYLTALACNPKDSMTTTWKRLRTEGDHLSWACLRSFGFMGTEINGKSEHEKEFVYVQLYESVSMICNVIIKAFWGKKQEEPEEPLEQLSILTATDDSIAPNSLPASVEADNN